MEEGKIQVHVEYCDLTKILKNACTMQQDVARNHVITCKISVVPDMIQADGAALDQIFTNLLANAIKYSPNEPNIEVTAWTMDDDVVIKIRDYGVGIDADEIDKVGDRFFRARTSIGVAGTGIGLNLARTLVELHEGVITVESTKGKGSSFTIQLPISGPEQAKRDQNKAA